MFRPRSVFRCSLNAYLSLHGPSHRSKGSSVPCPADPFADPAHDPCNGLRGIASNTLTAVAFTLIMVSALVQSLSMLKWGAWWMLCLVIGEYTFALGIGMRFGLHSHPDSKGIYIAEYLFVVLSPCAFIAADYILLGRLARFLRCEKHLLVPAHRITAIFLSSDVTTFLIQAAGGGVSIGSTTAQGAQTGSNIFLAGLAIQLLSFLIFTCTLLVFLYRVHKHEQQTWTIHRGQHWYTDWRSLAVALLVSCVGILIRSVYRTIELSQGFEGPIATNEGFFYGLDTLPLFVAVVVYCPFWPGRFIPPSPSFSISNMEAAPEKSMASQESDGRA
ncbi:lipid-translocating exporter [Heterobasidion irregulare TC 32-1]|uniref:Lipid-translocating exporter n=1 Tax=Heterobasidion irregulare (strain TC 32-1) TaxID=747525 RepID=W4KF78_HETIT|nr:lipid-translocating exporter [Heterobasidion irregulare TC 32-1]ETW83965.1 lipid-translocating exporter [Heterobasidion irregulare TC 32-1]